MFGSLSRNTKRWAETTSFHGPAEVIGDRPMVCNIFWISVMILMAAIAIIVNYGTIANYMVKTPITSVDFEEFKDLAQMLEFYELVYCSSSFLNITKLIKDRVKYASVIYLLLLIEGDTITDNGPKKSQSMPGENDEKFRSLRDDPNSAKPNFGGGLVNFLTLPIEVDGAGQMTGYRDNVCQVCVNQSGNCLTPFLQDKTIMELERGGLNSPVSFHDYLVSKNFTSVQGFLLHYAVNYQRTGARTPKYVLRFRRLCQFASAYSEFKHLDTATSLIYEMEHDQRHISPCNVHRRAISFYTDPTLMEDEVSSFPFVSDITTSDQVLFMMGQARTLTFFKLQTTRYSNLKRPDNNCIENDRIVTKYPFDADAYTDCVQRCLHKIDNASCFTRLITLDPQYEKYYCLQMKNWPNFYFNDDFIPSRESPSMDDQDVCISGCQRVKKGFCTTYRTDISLEQTEIDRQDDPDATMARFSDTIFMRSSKTVLSFNEQPQYGIGAVVSQIGGNLGLFLGASWVSFIHMCVICCCYSKYAGKKTVPDSVSMEANYGPPTVY